MTVITFESLKQHNSDLSTRQSCDRALGVIGNHLHSRYDDLANYRERGLRMGELRREITRLKRLKAHVIEAKRAIVDEART